MSIKLSRYRKQGFWSQEAAQVSYLTLRLSKLIYVEYTFRYGPYSGSSKIPDFYFRPTPLTLPTLVVECGWSESANHLYNDMKLLLEGSNGSIKVVMIVKWTQLQGTKYVSGIVELFKRDRDGELRLEQCEVCQRILINISHTTYHLKFV